MAQNAQQSVAADSPVSYIAQAAVAVGDLWQGRDGRAGFWNGSAAVNPAQPLQLTTVGQVVCPFVGGSVGALDGGNAYWDRTNKVITYTRLGGNRGFLAGSFLGDVPAGASTCAVNLNRPPVYELDLLHRPFKTAIVKTAGAPALNWRGAIDLSVDAQNEAQKVDALGDGDFVLTGSKPILEAEITVIANGAGASTKFYLGLASATHATDPSNVAVLEYIYVEIDSNTLKINALSYDGSTTVAKTDTTKTFVVGTRFEVWLDLRVPGSCGIWVNGVRVLPGIAFSLAAGAQNLFPLAWLGKTASTDTMEVRVDRCRVRTAEQSVLAA